MPQTAWHKGIDFPRAVPYGTAVRDYQKLQVWHRAYEVTLLIYPLTAQLPRAEAYDLRAQMRRSAVSVVCNIAEGAGRASQRDFSRFLSIAAGSASELQCQLQVSRDLGLFGTDGWEEALAKTIEVKRMLASLIGRLAADA